MPLDSKPIAIICNYCGSANVSRDAWADWSAERQEWQLGAVFDHAHCYDCEAETSLAEVPLAGTHG